MDHLHSIDSYKMRLTSREATIQLITICSKLPTPQTTISFNFDVVRNYYDGASPKVTALQAIMFRQTQLTTCIVALLLLHFLHNRRVLVISTSNALIDKLCHQWCAEANLQAPTVIRLHSKTTRYLVAFDLLHGETNNLAMNASAHCTILSIAEHFPGRHPNPLR